MAQLRTIEEVQNQNYFLPGRGHINIVSFKPSKKNKNEFKRIEYRLREWGVWVVKSVTNGLGYPSQSTLVTALQGSRSTAPHYPKDNAYAEEVHALVVAMGRRHPDWKAVLDCEYTEAGTQERKALKLGFGSKRAYQLILDKAKSWVESGIES